MLGSLFVNITALVLAGIGSRKNSRIFLGLSFFVLFVFLAIRYDYGNDLPTYRAFFENIGNISLSDILGKRNGPFEIGYQLSNVVFSPLGFNSLLALFALLEVAAYFKVLVRTVPRKLYFFSIFILIFNPNLLLTESSAIRQTIAISLFFLSVRYLYERKPLQYVLICVLAMQFHQSAIILIPFYFLLTPHTLVRRNMILLVVLYFLIIYEGRFLISEMMKLVLSKTNSRYLGFFYATDEFPLFKIGSGIKVYFQAIVMLALIWLGRDATGYQAIAIRGTIYASLLLSLGFCFPLAGRLSMYLDPFMVMAIPSVLATIRRKELFYLCITVYGTYTLLLYFAFFRDPIWISSFSSYRTIFGTM